MTNFRIEKNAQFNSTEIFFEKKPEQATIDSLKAKKFRWNPRRGCWFGFLSAEEVQDILKGETAIAIPESTFVDGGGLYDGWQGGNNRKWRTDKELKAFLLEDFKKAGIKATIRFKRAGYLTSICVTMTIAKDEVKTLEQFREGYEVKPAFYNWLQYTDEDGHLQDLHIDNYYKLEGKEREEMAKNIMETDYRLTVDRLDCSGCGHSDYESILTAPAANRFKILMQIVASYNRDCTNSQIDYFDRDIYDDYCFKIV